MQEITVMPLEALYRLIGAASMIDSAECKDEAIYNTLQGELVVAKEVAKALAMAQKQEAPTQEPVAEIISGWQIVFAGAGPIAPIVEKHKLGIGAKLYAVGTVPPPEGWRDVLQRLRDNTETFGQYSQETARVAIEGCIDALEELEPVAAPAAANGTPGYAEKASPIAITDSSALNGIKWYVPPPEHLRNGMQLYFVAPQPVAAAGPDAALVKALEGTANLLASLGMDSSDEYQSALAALSSAKGN